MIATSLVALLLSATSPAGSPAPSAPRSRDLTAAQVRERVDAYLRTIDVPIEPDAWRALGPAALALLEEVALDRGELPTRRAQAVWALVHVSGPPAAPSLARLAGREDEPLAVRLAAVRGLGAVAPPEGLEPALRPLLERALDVRVRAGAAEALASRSAGRGCALLAARLATEAPAARATFSGAVRACAAAAR